MLNIRKGGHRDLERWYNMFEVDFDEKELLPKLELAYALVLCRNVYGYVLLKYFGVLPWYRSKGVGIQAMRMLNKRYAETQGILAEISVFDPEDTETRRKLNKYFARFGYEPLGCDYRLGGAEADLLVKPMKGATQIAPVADRVIRDFY